MRIPCLDGVRAIAMIFVLLAHLSGTRNFCSSHLLEMYGNFGVRVFLVLSGYLITYLLLKDQAKSGTISVRRFFMRRAYRIFPAAYAFMIIVIATNWDALSWPNILAVLTYTSSYYHGGHWAIGHLWLLSVQEQFYLLWPVTLFFFFRLRLPIVLGVIASGPPLRILFWLWWGRPGLEHPFPVFADALAMGCLLAIVQPRLRAWEHVLASRWFLVVPALTLLIPLIQLFNARAYQVAGLTMLHAGIAMSIQHAVISGYAILKWRLLTWIGTLSYSLYLWQQPFLNRGSTTLWTGFPLNVLLAFLFAAGSYYFLERPILLLRERNRQHAADKLQHQEHPAQSFPRAASKVA